MKDGLLLTDTSLWSAWQVQHTQIELGQDDVHLIDRLALSASDSPTEPVSAEQASTAQEPSTPATPARGTAPAQASSATHVLVGTRALALRGAEVVLGSGFALRHTDGAWTLHGDGALINGIPSTPVQPLALGDTLFLGAAGHGRLIEVLD